MRRKWIYHHGQSVEVDPYAISGPPKGPFIMSGDHYQYECPITGKPIMNKHEHNENLKAHGCRVLEKGERKEAPKRMEESFNENNERIVSNAVDDIAHEI